MSSLPTVNLAHVVHETIDGETILIHLGTGTYYSLDGVGAELWQLLADGREREELLAWLDAGYDADAGELERSLDALVRELLQEGLLTPEEIEGTPPAAAQGRPAPAPEGTRAQFVAPVLRKYTDMQEFMLVDPLHDVEADAGWPHVKTA